MELPEEPEARMTGLSSALACCPVETPVLSCLPQHRSQGLETTQVSFQGTEELGIERQTRLTWL